MATPRVVHGSCWHTGDLQCDIIISLKINVFFGALMYRGDTLRVALGPGYGVSL